MTKLRNRSLNHRSLPASVPGTPTFTLIQTQLMWLITDGRDLLASVVDGSVVVGGNAARLGRLVGLIAPVDTEFAIVTPRERTVARRHAHLIVTAPEALQATIPRRLGAR